ncbi:hypothetical protein K469DRAFT_743421 [Zopfia rhizophila CBS 207.26]|uniref:C2H2-type domain-containing protein n=1 Tax=Zopfia rhizophila CBS 207.26 TaxID=1314779 RepID=A0A6A6DC05_9PEZI|nr:hypothetical protein K469DRAFT_743421 [Zopfia rhizophila CBS 207.26]
MDSPNSDLSDYASDDFPEDVKGRRLSFEHTPDHEPSSRPSKRPRLNTRATPEQPHASAPEPNDGEISEDTNRSDQVTVCKWEGCDVPNLENMDNLVEYLHEDHIRTRQKKYSCDGYALRAHIRSHTQEKPFYCTLPECDRSFTHSNALAKHMRTVHETKALRPSNPVPKHHSSNPANRFQRLRLVLTQNHAQEKSSTPTSLSSHPLNSAIVPINADVDQPTMVQFLPDMNFTDQGEQLRAEAELLKKKRKEEWVAKELLVENMMEASLARMWRKRLEQGFLDEPNSWGLLEDDIVPLKKLVIKDKGGKVPWWREEDWGKRVGEAAQVREGVAEREVPLPEIRAEMKQEEPVTQDTA